MRWVGEQVARPGRALRGLFTWHIGNGSAEHLAQSPHRRRIFREPFIVVSGSRPFNCIGPVDMITGSPPIRLLSTPPDAMRPMGTSLCNWRRTAVVN